MGEMRGLRDNQQRMVELLREIARNTSDIERGGGQAVDITLEGANINERMGVVPHHAVRIKESMDLDDDNLDETGAVPLSPGDQRVLCEYDEGTHAVYAVGATDRNGVQYWLEVDGDPVIGPTFGALGTVNSPFSFVENYGGAIPADKRSKLMAYYPSEQTGDISLVGRLHVENIIDN